jgi:hypothetical protein
MRKDGVIINNLMLKIPEGKREKMKGIRKTGFPSHFPSPQ